ncbi:MAG TPA: hemerythrin domain-containing protein [Thermoanaerobaculia bacterium]|nr:hemerythrin domain-containing protein [Thermoanaerobaculia bacterium]
MTLREFMSADHDRLDALLDRIVRADGCIDEEAYVPFRRGLLTHIGIEERILFPEIRARGGDVALVEKLHHDHALIAALLMPPPTKWEIDLIKAVLTDHNPLEEGPDGLYAQVGDAVLDRVRAYPEVPVAPHSDTPHLRYSIELLLKRAGR